MVFADPKEIRAIGFVRLANVLLPVVKALSGESSLFRDFLQSHVANFFQHANEFGVIDFKFHYKTIMPAKAFGFFQNLLQKQLEKNMKMKLRRNLRIKNVKQNFTFQKGPSEIEFLFEIVKIVLGIQFFFRHRFQPFFRISPIILEVLFRQPKKDWLQIAVLNEAMDVKTLFHGF